MSIVISIARKVRHKLGACKRRIIMRSRLAHLLSLFPKSRGRVIVLATPMHGNLGDQAIVCAEKRILSTLYGKDNVFEIPNDYYLSFPRVIKRALKPDDVIVVDGGGNLGTIWENEDNKITDIVKRFRDNKILIFPQTCYYGEIDTSRARIKRNRDVYAQAKNLRVMLRDRASYQVFTQLFPETKAYYVPDIVLSLSPKISCTERKGALVCFRGDCEKVISKNEIEDVFWSVLFKRGLVPKATSTYIDCAVGMYNREQKLKEKFLEFASSQIVVTDRLHAMLFCAITGTPCVAMDNISKKVSGGYEWVKSLPFIAFVSKREEIEAAVTRVLVCKETTQRFVYPEETVKTIICEG